MIPSLVNINNLIDDQKCYYVIRSLRWPDKCAHPHCESVGVIKRGKDDIKPARPRYNCKSCQKQFDDLTNSIFSRHHQPFKLLILCLYVMGLNLSNHQISKELNLNKDDIHVMTRQLRQGIFVRALILDYQAK